ncbi:MAG: hypothetical protein HYR85_09700 [Planctomycetes bacterium]|nr:hypothetical protein [Planctomycetota bacterium]MBI3847965.1 hypothetical protein [Planctomycetota bacterium]
MSREGFSAIEVLIGIVLLAIVLPGLLTGIFALEAGSGNARMRTLACELAEDQLDEIASKAFEDPDLPADSFGTEEAVRANWDDVDDFDGLVRSPPTDALGGAITGASAFTRSVAVENVDDTNLDVPVADGSTDIKRITVTVTWPGVDHGPVILQMLKARPVSSSNGSGGTGWVYVPGSRTEHESRVQFKLKNNTGGAVELTALVAVWSSPVAFYEEIRLRVDGITSTKRVWRYQDVGSIRAKSGQTVPFTSNSPFNVPAGATITVQLRSFRTSQTGSGGGEVNMDATAFAMTLVAGGTNYPNIAVPAAP